MCCLVDPTNIPEFSDVLAGRCAYLRTSAEMRDLLRAVKDDLVEANYPLPDHQAIRLALEEAVVNALKHGHGYDPAKEVQVRWIVTPEHMLAEVADEGAGFDPEDVADPLSPQNVERPCGRGLLLMRHFMTAVRLKGRGNVVVLYKRRSV